MKKVAVVIPTLNAFRHGTLMAILKSVDSQRGVSVDKFIVDSSSTDQTRKVAETFGWKVIGIRREHFNHGLTRMRAVECLNHRGYDTVVFLSQDVALTTDDALKTLVEFLWSQPVSGCYGKQVSRHEKSLNAWQRLRCYPEESSVRSLDDVPRYGLMTVFFSNSFSAWKIRDVIRYGGFPETDFGEDTLLASQVLRGGGRIGYCSEAVVTHEHSNNPLQLFQRGMAVGAFHRRHPELLTEFGAPVIHQKSGVPLRVVFPLMVKCAGYAVARYSELLSVFGLFVAMWLLLVPAMVMYDLPLRDVAMRYAPMAEAFASGDWQFAFHPRVAPLLPVCAGLLVKAFGCTGWQGCQMASGLLLTLGLFPLYGGARLVYGRSAALVSAMLYACCSPLLRLGYYGTRETGSVLGMAALYYASARLLSCHRAVWGYVLFVVSEVLLLLSRGDMASFAGIAFVVLMVWDVVKHRIPWRSLCCLALLIGMLSPCLLANYREIGYPVVDVRQAAVMRIFCRRCPWLRWLENPSPRLKLDIYVPTLEDRHE